MSDGQVVAVGAAVMVDVKAKIKIQLLNGDWVEVAEIEGKFPSDASLPQISGTLSMKFWARIMELQGVAAETGNLDEPIDFIPFTSILRVRPVFPKIVTANRVPQPGKIVM